MSIIFKKTIRKNPLEQNEPGLYYPQLLTMGRSLTEEDIVYRIKERSSLSKGDIQSVVTNFMEETRQALYDGFSVNFRDFGVFGLSAKGEGAVTEDECTSRNIKAVRITFRASSINKPNLSSTRAGDKLKFMDLQTYLKSLGLSNNTGNGSGTGGDDSGNGDGGDDWQDPDA